VITPSTPPHITRPWRLPPLLGGAVRTWRMVPPGREHGNAPVSPLCRCTTVATTWHGAAFISASSLPLSLFLSKKHRTALLPGVRSTAARHHTPVAAPPTCGRCARAHSCPPLLPPPFAPGVADCVVHYGLPRYAATLRLATACVARVPYAFRTFYPLLLPAHHLYASRNATRARCTDTTFGFIVDGRLLRAVLRTVEEREDGAMAGDARRTYRPRNRTVPCLRSITLVHLPLRLHTFLASAARRRLLATHARAHLPALNRLLPHATRPLRLPRHDNFAWLVSAALRGELGTRLLVV